MSAYVWLAGIGGFALMLAAVYLDEWGTSKVACAAYFIGFAGVAWALAVEPG